MPRRVVVNCWKRSRPRSCRATCSGEAGPSLPRHKPFWSANNAAGIYGVTLEQASEAAVRRVRHSDGGDSEDDQHPTTTLARLSAAAECGLGSMVKALLAQLDGPFLRAASAAQLIEAAAVMQR